MEFALLGVSCCSMVVAGRCIQEDKSLRGLFEKVEKSRVLDMEHIPGIQGVPMNKPLCLRAKISGIEAQSALDKDTSAIVSMALPCFDNVENDDYHYEIEIGEAMINMVNGEGQNPCYVYNDNGEEVLLEFPKSGLKVHNVDIKDYDDVRLEDVENQGMVYKGNWEKWNLLLRRGYSLKEVSMRNAESYIFIGDLRAYDGNLYNPRAAQHVLKLFFITGDRKESALRHVDNLIGYYSRRSKSLMVTGIGISTCVLCYKKLVKPYI